MQNKLNIALFIISIIIFATLVLILPPDPQAEAFENRAMERMPQFSAYNVVHGGFFANLESYLLDNTAMRTNWLTFADIAAHSHGITLPGGAMMIDFAADDLGIGLTPLLDAETASHNLTGRQVDLNQPFSIDHRFDENAIFYLRYRENQTHAARYAQVLNAHAAGLPDDVRMFSMLAPVKVEFMGPRYAAVNSSQLGTIEFVNALLDPRIITVDAHSILAENAEQYIFFRLDHHWTSLGAYFAYLAFAEAAGFAPIGIENYVEYEIDGFVGSLAVGTRNRTILDNPDTLHFHRLSDGTSFCRDLITIPADLSQACYRIFLGGDVAFLHFTSNNLNGRTLMVVKDSFANALVPWIAPHYENIVMIDPRQYVGSIANIVAEFDNIDLLYVNYIPATTMPDLIEQIYNVR